MHARISHFDIHVMVKLEPYDMTEGNGNRSWLEIDSVYLSRVFVK